MVRLFPVPQSNHPVALPRAPHCQTSYRLFDKTLPSARITNSSSLSAPLVSPKPLGNHAPCCQASRSEASVSNEPSTMYKIRPAGTHQAILAFQPQGGQSRGTGMLRVQAQHDSTGGFQVAQSVNGLLLRLLFGLNAQLGPRVVVYRALAADELSCVWFAFPARTSWFRLAIGLSVLVRGKTLPQTSKRLPSSTGLFQ